ncbi:MarR family winged helix-turn-helix transcriptional regulator [Metabacillus sediminilitoris]|jgi:MarR family 2-MHQ and catechol resistance regulon transcriptional repressor|uniref:MarR family transcriptional regulator n=1 Tax=Metabacillus sediminilitoris TaxID=2567941 RepID=A0A4S4BQY5_9BACI|nr:MarR family transcriptional regulator [Metabacillus sediminilitoris]QGQ46391.1 MarR family transcriptional regulator [Metabacillus sediminilitoris]THF77378.1 MarR family transcriptional regulator [Metabacillus sediminilitoris]
MNKSKQTEESLKFFIVLSRAHRAFNDAVNKHISTFNLNPTEFAVLELLYHKGDQPLQQIGGKILLASGSITYVVDKLEQKGLLARKACPTDRRVTFAQITENGKKLIEEIFPTHQERINEIVSVLTDEEKNMVTEMLKKVGFHANDFLKS